MKRPSINLSHQFDYTNKLSLATGIDKGFSILVKDRMLSVIKDMLFYELVCDGKGSHEFSRRKAYEAETILAEKIEPVIMNFKLSIIVTANDPIGEIHLRMNEIEE